MILFYSGGRSGAGQKGHWPENYGLSIMLSYFELRDGEGGRGDTRLRFPVPLKKPKEKRHEAKTDNNH